MRLRGVVLTAAAFGLATGGTAAASAAPAAATQTVSYQGYTFTVPASWPVINLAQQPDTCVRYDRHALYLGTPGAQQDCPPDLVGRTEALSVQPAGTAGAGASIVDSKASGEFDATAPGIKVLGSYDTDPALISGILAKALPAGTPVTDATVAKPAAANADAAKPSGTSAATISPGALNVIGSGIDTCATPSESVMAHLTQVAGAIGLNIGGPDESCAQPNLTAQWVADEAKAGWDFWLTYTGPQAPGTTCTSCGVITDPAGQALTAAQDAVDRVQSLGFPAGIPIIYDMQGYTEGGSDTTTALQFESDWTVDLHQLGYQSGIYGPMASTVQDLTTAYSGGVYTMPDVIDFSDEDGLVTAGDPAVPTADWPSDQRIHQWSTDVVVGTGAYATEADYDAAAVNRVPDSRPGGTLYLIDLYHGYQGQVTEDLGNGSWLPIGGPTVTYQLYVGLNTVFATSLDNAAIYEYDGVPGQWTQIGGAAEEFAVVGDTLYGLTPSGSAVEKWSGHGTTWTTVGGAASAIYGGSFALVATNPANTAVNEFNPANGTWTAIGGGGSKFVEHGQTLIGLAQDHSYVAEWSGAGTKWTAIGGTAETVYGSPTDNQNSGTGIFALSPSGYPFEYLGGGTWTKVGTAGNAFTVDESGLYGSSPGGKIFEWSGSGTSWDLAYDGSWTEWGSAGGV